VKILVTGATGHIGRHVCRRLAEQGHQVNALALPGTQVPEFKHPNVKAFAGTTSVPESVAAALEGCSTIVHAAGIKNASRDSTFHRLNVKGTAALTSLAAQFKIEHFIFVSSLAAQGPSKSGHPHRVAGNESPLGAYGASQLRAEKEILNSKVAGQSTILRPAIVYGPHDPDLLNWARLAKRRVLPFRPDLELSFVHVYDLADLIVALTEAGRPIPGPHFLSDGTIQTMESVVDQLERALDSGPSLRILLSERIIKPMTGPLQKLTAASGLLSGFSQLLADLNATGWTCTADLATKRLGFQSNIDFPNGFRDTIRWYQAQGLV
jgi:nucleoside-diphosphate-sugar epimerase